MLACTAAVLMVESLLARAPEASGFRRILIGARRELLLLDHTPCIHPTWTTSHTTPVVFHPRCAQNTPSSSSSKQRPQQCTHGHTQHLFFRVSLLVSSSSFSIHLLPSEQTTDLSPCLLRRWLLLLSSSLVVSSSASTLPPLRFLHSFLVHPLPSAGERIGGTKDSIQYKPIQY